MLLNIFAVKVIPLVVEILLVKCKKGAREEVYDIERLLEIGKCVLSKCRSLNWIKVTHLLLFFHCFIRLYQTLAAGTCNANFASQEDASVLR